MQKMPEITELLKKRKKLRKRKSDKWEYEPDSDHPVHEKYTKEEPWKEG